MIYLILILYFFSNYIYFLILFLKPFLLAGHCLHIWKIVKIINVLHSLDLKVYGAHVLKNILTHYI